MHPGRTPAQPRPPLTQGWCSLKERGIEVFWAIPGRTGSSPISFRAQVVWREDNRRGAKLGPVQSLAERTALANALVFLSLGFSFVKW